MVSSKIIVAIDGFSSCGKSTLAKQLAKKLNYVYVDSGAMYRAITLYFLRNSIDFSNPTAIELALKNLKIHFELNEITIQQEVFLNDENVENSIREMLVAEKVSEISSIKSVRHFAVDQQKKMGKKKGIVMDGRDIGTVVFPTAELKIFMTADPEIRVLRRFNELYPSHPEITLEEVKNNLELRDYMDSNREESPLTRAEDAILLNNSNLSREEQLEKVMNWVNEKMKL